MANAIILIVSLEVLFISCFLSGLPLLGLFIVLLCGSSPFILYESYGRENIFALLPCMALLLLAINLQGLFNKTKGLKIVWKPVLSGILLATAAHIRGETQSLLLAASILICFWQCEWRTKIIYLLFLFASFFICKSLWFKYFDAKWKQSYELVKASGGHTYDGPSISGHRFWHPVFCGLGDFDTKYGYQWDDIYAYKYALPIMKNKYELDLKYTPGKYGLDEYYDRDKKYYKKLDFYQEYEDIMRDRVLHDIKKDPKWYFHILYKRARRILSETSQVFLSWKTEKLPITFTGYMAAALAVLLLVFRQRALAAIILFSLPISASTFIIYSGEGATYSAIYHLLALAVLALLIKELPFLLLKKNRS